MTSEPPPYPGESNPTDPTEGSVLPADEAASDAAPEVVSDAPPAGDVPPPPAAEAAAPPPPPPSADVPPPPPAMPPPPPVEGPATTGANNQKALISLILGIVGIVVCWCCYGILSIPAGIAAIVLSRQAQSEIAATGQAGAGMAKAGFILGIVSIGLAVLGILLSLAFFGTSSFMNY